MEVYAKALKRRERLAGSYRDAFDRALEWARMRTSEDQAPGAGTQAPDQRTADTA